MLVEEYEFEYFDFHKQQLFASLITTYVGTLNKHKPLAQYVTYMLQQTTYLFFLTLVSLTTALGQNCIHKELSKKYNYNTSFRRIDNNSLDSCMVEITVVSKVTKKPIQTIRLTSTYMFEDVFKTCKSVRSYVTGTNKNDEVLDNDFGDFIVADFNFDGKEDIAIKKDSGGNGGPVYNFYLQDKNGLLILNSFLSNRVQFFPSINKTKKTLITYVHAGVCGLGEHVYLLNLVTNQWHQISHRTINICKD